MRVLMVGATGVVGRPAVAALVAAGHDVTGLTRSPAKAAALLAAGATPVEFDLFDPAAARAAVDGHDAVIHAATHIPPISSFALPRAWAENDRLRREGTRVLVDAAIDSGVSVFVKESVSFGYADAGDSWIDESARLDPAPNVDSALVAESETERFAQVQGRRGVVLRFAGFYGPDAAGTHDTVKLARRGLAAIVGRPDAYVSAIHTDDAAAALVAALDAPPGTYNVADDEPLTRRDHFDALAAAFGLKRPRFLPTALGRLGGNNTSIIMRSQRVANRRFRGATSWAPRFPSARQGWRAIAEAWSAAAARA